MTLAELIAHYADPSLPKPAYTTLCALQRFAPVERCRYAVQCKGVTVAAFHNKGHAEAFADLGRLSTPLDSPIEVVDLYHHIDAAKGGQQG